MYVYYPFRRYPISIRLARSLISISFFTAATCARRHSSFILRLFAEGYWVNSERSGDCASDAASGRMR